jgi:serine/threonine-protein kinase
MTTPQPPWKESALRKVTKYVSGSGVPPDLLRIARSRVAILSLFVIAISTVSCGAFHFFSHVLPPYISVNKVIAVWTVLGFVSLGMYIMSRIRGIRPQLLLDIAMVYEVLIAFGIGWSRHFIVWEQTFARDWSEVAVWIFMFSVFIPNTPWKILLAAAIASLMDPLGLLLSVQMGNPWPPSSLLQQMFIPTFFVVLLSYWVSRIIYRMGSDIQKAQQMGGYVLVEPIGKGGMGEVWRGKHTMLARAAAIKLIPAKALAVEANVSDSTLLKRFEREAQATAMLEPMHTIHLYDFGVTKDGVFYYVMEYLEGMSLEDLVERFGPVPAERAVHILKQVCISLAEAHHNGLIHRDIKPGNIYLCKKGLERDFVKVLDFGLVTSTFEDDTRDKKLTMEGWVTGTPAFIAPEMALDEAKVDQRADIYSLGCVAYWLLCGCLVFDRSTPMKTVLAHVNEKPVPISERSELEVPKELEDLVHACLAKKAGDRPQSIAELAEKLKAIPLANSWTQARAEQWWKSRKLLD